MRRPRREVGAGHCGGHHEAGLGLHVNGTGIPSEAGMCFDSAVKRPPLAEGGAEGGSERLQRTLAGVALMSKGLCEKARHHLGVKENLA